MLFYLTFIIIISQSYSFSNNFFNHWHCIGIAENINFKIPYKTNIGELPLVLWKNKNDLLSTINICKHMGSKLDNGCITKDKGNLQCQYHGYEYTEKDTFGKTMIYDGKIFWSYNPIDEYPHAIPHYDDKQYETSILQFDMNCGLKDSVLNTMDLLHPEYVHSKIVGFGNKIPSSNIKNYYIDNSTLGLSFDYISNKLIQNINNVDDIKTHNYHMFHYPTFTWSRVTSDKIKHIIIGVNFLPLEKNKTRWYVTVCHNYLMSPIQKQMVKLMVTTILTQDFIQMNNQYNDNSLKDEIILSHSFSNEKIILELNNMMKSYEYPTIDIVTELYKNQNEKN